MDPNPFINPKQDYDEREPVLDDEETEVETE